MKKLLIGLITIALAACSSRTDKSKIESEKIILADKSIISLNLSTLNEERSKYLRVITRGNNASAVAGDVTKTILCNPFSLFSLIGACRATIYTHSKEDLLGNQTTILNISETYAYPKYKSLLQQTIQFSEVKDYSVVPVAFVLGSNYLVYDNEHYKLNVEFGVKVAPNYNYGSNQALIQLTERDFVCKEEKSGFTFEQWEANNYALAVSEGKKLVDRCFERLDKHHFNHLGKQIEDHRTHFL